MNLFDTSIASLVNQTRSVSSNTWPLFSLFGGGAATAAGKKINHNSSLKVSGFWCGIKNISDTIGYLPLQVFEETDKGVSYLKDHPVNQVIFRRPNQCMSAFNFWKTLAVSQLIKGNGYAKIIRDGAGNVRELQLLHPEDVTVYRLNNQLWYQISGEKNMYFSDEIFHVPGFSWNGITGIGVIQFAADNMAISLSADQFGSNAFGDRGLSYGVLETEKSLNKKGKDNIAKIFNQRLNSADKHRLAVFDEGMSYKRIALSPQETQFIETKAEGVDDIARWLNIPLHKLHKKGEGGYNFLVQMSIEYLMSCIMPLAQPIMEEIDNKLFANKEKSNGIRSNADYQYILQADPKARAQYYKDMVYIKAMSPNEVRKKEGLNPYKGGDEFLQMSNMLNEKQIQKELSDG
ncbi:phage portal protein [Flagellimonas sp. S174]|uniref:phage portal protein n=1 Tax=Flagellimonas sp. S174 TaxID=3410790 RepID=UPI003BF464E6